MEALPHHMLIGNANMYTFEDAWVESLQGLQEGGVARVSGEGGERGKLWEQLLKGVPPWWF